MPAMALARSFERCLRESSGNRSIGRNGGRAPPKPVFLFCANGSNGSDVSDFFCDFRQSSSDLSVWLVGSLDCAAAGIEITAHPSIKAAAKERRPFFIVYMYQMFHDCSVNAQSPISIGHLDLIANVSNQPKPRKIIAISATLHQARRKTQIIWTGEPRAATHGALVTATAEVS